MQLPPPLPGVPQVVAGLKEVRDRISSVKNTQKITEAMKLVAAAKVRRAQEAVINSRPFTENLVKVWHSFQATVNAAGGGGCGRRRAAGDASSVSRSGLSMRSPVPTQVLYGVNQRLKTEDVESPLCVVRPVKTVLLVVLTGDRGLCGGYNNFILKKVRIRCRFTPASQRTAQLAGCLTHLGQFRGSTQPLCSDKHVHVG